MINQKNDGAMLMRGGLFGLLSLFCAMVGTCDILPNGLNPADIGQPPQRAKMKGCMYFDGWGSFGGTSWAGWGIQKRLRSTPDSSSLFEPVYTAAEARAATDATLRDNPVFSRSPDWLVGANVLSSGQINDMLGMGIPALTPSTGRTAIGSFTQNDRPQFDLNTDPGNAAGFKPNGWPTEGHSKQDDGCWMHNDMKDVGYFYSYRLFDKIIEQGGLN